ncbi:MAG TPA: helix-turn-helix transcriptional regulator [Ktedonobacteraceae bacterium]|nr:helix-turn-helix transcriptional regulator [Ktedonobacteraceae bacterium]
MTTRLKIKEVMQAQGMSQRKLCRLTGIDVKNVQRVLRRPIGIVNTATLDKYAKALGVDVSLLVETVPDEEA